MHNIPIIKIELEGLRRSVSNALISSNDEINNIVLSSLENQLTEEWVRLEIDAAVKKCLKSSIEEIANNWHMRNAISELIAVTVADKLGEKS